MTFTQEYSFQEKIPFLWLANADAKPPFFEISRLKLQQLSNLYWASETES